MKRWTVVVLGATAAAAGSLLWMISAYMRDIDAARWRVAAGSEMAAQP